MEQPLTLQRLSLRSIDEVWLCAMISLRQEHATVDAVAPAPIPVARGKPAAQGEHGGAMEGFLASVYPSIRRVSINLLSSVVSHSIFSHSSRCPSTHPSSHSSTHLFRHSSIMYSSRTISTHAVASWPSTHLFSHSSIMCSSSCPSTHLLTHSFIHHVLIQVHIRERRTALKPWTALKPCLLRTPLCIIPIRTRKHLPSICLSFHPS